MTGNEIRKTFLRFFEERGHRVVRSSSLVPANDLTLLFTNAGMNQFKDVFLGLEQRDYNRATSCQKCVRAGGKHNDLENVGFTNRHHTFFEMLGNFSFGDYFSEEAISLAWELLTTSRGLGIPIDKLYFTVFGGADTPNQISPDFKSDRAWKKVGAPTDRIFLFSGEKGLKENFWAMGDTGPCGPCSEIFYDMGPAAVDNPRAPDCAAGNCAFPCDCGRYVEIWNLVFMQFNRDPSGKLEPLPKPSVDTGMGLERITAALLNLTDRSKVSNYDTDLFQPLIREAAQLTGLSPGSGEGEDATWDSEIESSLRIIADHSRAATFLVSDGVLPSNEGRGYVLRKIINRCLVHSGLGGASLVSLLPSMATLIAEQMKEAYPELLENLRTIATALNKEAERYVRTTESALAKLNEEISHVWKADDESRKGQPGTPVRDVKLTEHFAFKLYDTYGLPRDLMDEAARLRGIEIDWAEFERDMKEQRDRGRASWKGAHKDVANPAYTKLAATFKTEPDFYYGTEARDCRIEAIITKDGPVNEIKPGMEAEVVLDRTSIYSESGGQVADTGGFYDSSESLQVAEVRGAYYPVSRLVAHRIVAKEDLHVGDRVATLADPERRARNMRNHTATHLMHAALRNILGTHVKQAGSLVAPDHLRFDFSHFAAVDPAELAEIEQQVNDEILKDLEMRTDIMNIDDALASGALAFFGDKYPEANVRVVTIPDGASPRGFYSKELCGGTHVSRTGEIGMFKILAEQSAAAGVRRIEAISGDRALADYQRALTTLRSAAGMLNTPEDGVLDALERQFDTIKSLERQLDALKRKAAGSQAGDLLSEAKEIKGVRVLAARVNGFDREALRQMVDSLRQKLGSGVVVLASAEDGKVALITAVTKDLIPKLHAGKIVQELAKLVGGSGGGRPDLAEAGGKDTSGIENALQSIYPLLDRLL
jgi:alanyl-tRNA synthetase